MHERSPAYLDINKLENLSYWQIKLSRIKPNRNKATKKEAVQLSKAEAK